VTHHHERQPVVINVVYDGPPETGKTTSVRALAKSFGREVYTPHEQNGRTVYFDWLEHTGGRFEGAPIRCEVVSVPGQTRWSNRRRHFLEQADAIVFVGDTSAPAWPQTLARLTELRAWLDARGGVPVGIVFQANFRDAASALPMERVRAQIGSSRIAVVESVATEGSGVREGFVFAVRLALDRLRELARDQPSSRRSPRDAREELEFLKCLSDESELGGEKAPAAPSASPTGGHLAPSHDAPSGLVWPPVEGRIVLRDAADSSNTSTYFDHQGDCVNEAGGAFQMHSERDAVYTDFELGRARLIAWARVHANAQPLLSPSRCIVLAETGDGRWRLWQVVRGEASLRELFVRGLDRADAADVARRLATVSRLLAEAKYLCAATSLPLPCSLDTIGGSELEPPRYIGMLPLEVPLCAGALPSAEHVAGELASLLRGQADVQRGAVREAVQYTHAAAFGAASGPRIRELLSQLLA
jgi:signal recognition particle receptor subunit beta